MFEFFPKNAWYQFSAYCAAPIDPAKLKKLEDFSEEEQKTIFEDRVSKSLSREKVAEKHETSGKVVNEIITKIFKDRKEKNDLINVKQELPNPVPLTIRKIQSEYPDYPKKTEG